MMDIKENVRQLIEKHQTNDPFRIAEALNIIIVYENLGDILGYYSKSHRFQVIHINENSSEEQQVFTCAHELGHAILHPSSNSSFLKKQTLFSNEKIELEANFWAMSLLFSSVNECVTKEEAIEQYGIPMELLTSHAHKIF
ncbi:ImmA/IrrE family metallo-endopeptidase [Virgibacillus pantothenticus]|nr:ImmA/IrrE family metallo-endopeptidase [Virgibacillus pantothenticus]